MVHLDSMNGLNEGTLALAGGDEFRDSMSEVDRELLTELGASPRVGIVPTAAASERPELAAQNGVEHFHRLGARAEAVMIIDQRSAGDGSLIDLLSHMDLIYLAGGSPGLLLSILAGSAAWRSILERHLEGATLAGSSAGAMVLCEKMRSRDFPWRDALGLVKGLAVLPHFNKRGNGGWADQAAQDFPSGIKLLGIDEGTAAINRRGKWRAAGAGKVTLVSKSGAESFERGQVFEI